ncbi:MAG: ribosome biogenesis GTP-binding protein YihA/YsxC [Lachnospiraceae bacterium]|jgi:ribosome biogenesis GTP-binding protein ysxC|nr:ribosome biogenesis GTP-binding protein YihA/YsxC [Lachnoclostridium sp.]MDY2599200.1 ribosome biogenesis GTP-binding protein YihA/YsxC [Lachnospiraceae bacterium]
MKIKNVALETVCGITSKLPENDKVELAFIGRSNVGKSSLINTLLNRKSLARTSSQPGKTQTINYYNINDAFYLVDLPGYGYAKISREVKEKWKRMTLNYFNNSKMLRVVFQLIDIRHDPTEKDKEMYDTLLQCGFSPIIIATKADKIKRSQLNKQVKAIEDKLQLVEGTPVIPFSSSDLTGKDELWEYIDEYVESFSE